MLPSKQDFNTVENIVRNHASLSIHQRMSWYYKKITKKEDFESTYNEKGGYVSGGLLTKILQTIESMIQMIAISFFTSEPFIF